MSLMREYEQGHGMGIKNMKVFTTSNYQYKHGGSMVDGKNSFNHQYKHGNY